MVHRNRLAALTLPPLPDLDKHLADLLSQVPAGRVTTFGALGRALGDVRAARWVATRLQQPHDWPGHRVVLKDGTLPGEGPARDSQQQRLIAEGTEVTNGRVDLERFGGCELKGSRPLIELRAVQHELIAALDLTPPRRMPQRVAGVDVSYVSERDAVAAYVEVDVKSGAVVWSTNLRRPVAFPYIPTYLSFRELPILLELLAVADEARHLCPVVLVDGAGLLHQHHAGIATHLGLMTSLSTIGVSKKRLCGQVDLAGLKFGEARPVEYRGRTIAAALQTRPQGPPVYVSPGQHGDLDFALATVRAVTVGHRLPEPTHWAHHFSRNEARALRGSHAFSQ